MSRPVRCSAGRLFYCLAVSVDARHSLMRTRQRIRLHLDTGRSIDGVLLAKRGDMYELGDVRLELDGKLQPIDERVFVPKHRVEFAQRGSAS